MKLIAITYSYYEDHKKGGWAAQRVVGVYSADKLDEALKQLKEAIGSSMTLVSQSRDEKGFYLDYGADGEFYSGIYNLNEIGKI